MKWGYKNLAESSLSGGVLVGATSLSLKTGDGAKFPNTLPFRAIIWSKDFQEPVQDPNHEIVEVTLDSGDDFNIVRAKEGTTARAWNEDDHFMLVVSAEQLSEMEAKTKIKSYELEIDPEDWEDSEAVMEVVGITPTNIVWIAPHPDSYDDYIEAGIRAIAQDEDELTFSCEEEPEETITINIVFE